LRCGTGVRPAREEPLVILGPHGLGEHLDALERAHGAYVRDPGFPVERVELAPGERRADPAGRFTLAAHATPHTAASLAYRVETEAGTVGYTGDTGPSEELGRFFAGFRR
jgi:ribonuclease BN (tRNA processing enzyme)